MNDIKIINGVRQCKPLSKIVIIKDGFQHFNPTEEMLLEDGWVPEENLVTETTENEAYVDVDNEINELKDMLTSTDYKVIKCMEAFLCGKELPYDIYKLSIERNNQRDRINQLENSIE